MFEPVPEVLRVCEPGPRELCGAGIIRRSAFSQEQCHRGTRSGERGACIETI